MNIKNIIKWGILLGVAEIIGTQMLTWLGLGLTIWFIIKMYLLVVVFAILGLRDLKNQKETKFSFLNTVIWVVGVMIISRLIFQSYMFIYIHYIDPYWVETTVKSWAATLEESGYAAETIEEQLKNFRKSFETVTMFTSGVISYAFPQILVGIIIGGIYVLTGKSNE